MEIIKIYVSDQMTGLSQEEIEKNFKALEKKVRHLYEQHYNKVVIINPAFKEINTCNGFEYEQCLQHDFRLIDNADVIFLGKNWLLSNGAKRELLYALSQKKKVDFECDYSKFCEDWEKFVKGLRP